MRAAFIETLGPPENIRCGALPAPVAGPTDVLVDVLATTVNPVDTLVRSGVLRTPAPFPLVVGRDLVGTVAEAGPGAPGFAVGDLVWSNSLGHGGQQGAAADRLYHLPDGVDPAAAVAMVHPAATAYLGLFTHVRVRAGETVLVAGAAGNVGGALVVLAAEAGARVIATASARDATYCRDLGAAEFLDYRDADLGKRIDEVCPDGVDDMKDCSLAGFVISRATGAELAEAAVTINRLLLAGRLRPRSVERLPLSAAAETHRRREQGQLHGGRVLLMPRP